MKKIFAILSVVAMMFAACTPDKGGNTPVPPPTFPALQEITVESGKSYEVTFSTDRPWTVSLSAESAVYATLTYTSEDGYTSTDTQFYGAAGEHTVVVNVREDAVSYAKDIVIVVDMTLSTYTESIALLTVKRTPYEITVTGTVTEGESTFEKGGHPADGPFVSVPNTYKVTYKNRFDGPEAAMIVEHNFDKLYNYRVYAKSKDEEGNVSFGPMAADDNGFPWVSLVTFGPKREKFRLTMEHAKSDAVFTEGVGYEAYVNIEDAKGDAVVSVYFLYDPNAEVVVETKMELANPELAEQNGIVFENNGYSCTMTYKTAESFISGYLAGALKFTGYTEVYGGFGSGTTNLVFEHNEESDIWYVRLAEGVSVGSLVREDVLNISAVSDELHSYTINLVFDWIKASDDASGDGTVSFVNAEKANAAGATLVKLDSSSADYNSEWGVESQYCLTYTSAELLATPATAALNVPGFGLGMIVNIEDMGADHFNYSEALEFSKDATTGEVLLSLRKDE